jgi:hypothetical protein
MCSNACIFGITFGVMWGIIGLITLGGYLIFLVVGNPYTARRGDKKKKKVIAAMDDDEEEIVEVIDNNEPTHDEESTNLVAGNSAKSVKDSDNVAAEVEKSNEPAFNEDIKASE